MLRGVIFDVDGTLAETRDVCIEAFQNAIEIHAGSRPSPTEVVALWGPTEEGVLRAAIGSGWEPAVGTFLSEYERLHASVPEPFPGIRSVLDLLDSSGIPAAVVTGKGINSTLVSLELLGLADAFEFVEAGSIDGAVKAEKITSIVGRWGVPSRTVAYVGDHRSDVSHAHEAGVIAVAAAWSRHANAEKLRRSGPDEFFDDMSAFAAWLADEIRSR